MKLQKNAITVSWALICILLLLAVGIGFGFTYAVSVLKQQALATNHAKIDNELAESEIAKLKTLSSYLENNQETVKRASEVVAESRAYTYQNQVIADLNSYASRSDVRIVGIDFPDVSKQNQRQQTKNSGATIAGVKRIPVVVRMDQSVRYSNLIRLVKLIEQNLTKIQITSVTMAPDPKAPGSMTSPTINIEVFIQ